MQQTIIKYLDSKLVSLHNSFNYAASACSDSTIEDVIFYGLTSKKYRKWSLDDDTADHIRKAIKISLSSGNSISVIYPFGGYKAWNLPSAPMVDWSEYISILYYIEYLSFISNIYKPGVKLTFSSDDYIVEKIDNIPREKTNQYIVSFRKLLSFLSDYIPDNFSISLFRTCDLYGSKDELEKELATNIINSKKYYSSLSNEQINKEVQRAKNSIQWSGKENLAWLNNDKDKAVQYIYKSLIYHGAYMQLKKRQLFNRSERSITIGSQKSRLTVPVGSTKRSVVKFWTGCAAIALNSHNALSSTILSANQIQQLKHDVIDVSDTIATKKLQNNNFNYIYFLCSTNSDKVN